MKKTLFFMLTLMCVLFASAQETVTLKFSSTTTDGSYFPFDVVNVTNVTRSWTESLTYPDTTMVLTSYDGLPEKIYQEGFISEVYPNPLSGTAYVYFEMGKSGLLNAKVLSINGSVLSEYTEFIDEGAHQIIINMSKPQMAFLVLRTNNNQYIKKILNIDSGSSDNISINKVLDITRNPKTRDGGEFVIGDIMSYMAVSFVGNNMIESNRITQAQYSDETIILTFPITNPSVSTVEITNISINTAGAGGVVLTDGGGTVSARGVCWSTNQNPTISSSHTLDGSGVGSFTSSLTGLSSNTTYYVRAYATNETGTAYGNQVTFTTNQDIVAPSVTTNDVSNITTSTATCGGNVTSSGNGTVIARGVCWSASQNPTINDNHTNDGNGLGSFISNITELSANTTYYVRAYATNEIGTNYGEQVSFTTETLNVPTGAISGLFSVSADQQVYFSQGNLQYQASTDTWKFAENQYDYVGSTNSNISSFYSGWIDLFGWGTSGYHNANDPYNVNYQPWSTTSSPQVYSSYNFYGYGPSTNMTDPNLTGTSANYDWGVYNPISNGGNTADQWRTLTRSEWYYVFNTRNTTSGIRYAKAKVNNIKGVILLPDDWSSSTYSLSSTNSNGVSFSSNTLTAAQWTTLEQAGAVFLPAAGARSGTTVYLSSLGNYWSASYYDSNHAYNVSFSDGNLNPGNCSNRYYGQSVRLVCPAEKYSFGINAVADPEEGGTVEGGGTYEQGQSCTLTATANEGYTFANWTENDEVVSTYVTYIFTVTGDRTLVANFTANGGGGGDHAYVDLGLPSGLLWAACNMGAENPEDYGDYFAWGETQPKDYYDWDTYQYCMGSYYTLTKYCNNSSYGYKGFTDNLTALLPEDDVATANWGEGWRMPTKEEWQELYNNTTVIWTTQNGVNGRLLTASNGNTLFLPAAGYRDDSSLSGVGSYGYYWSSSLDTGYPYLAWGFNFGSDICVMGGDYRDLGSSVRPVRLGQN